MEYVELVVKLPKEAYQLLKNEGVDWLGAEHILNAVAKGTLLPEGHGDLIDVNRLIEEFEEECAGECGCCGRVDNCPVFTQQTVIKAESEDKE